MVDADRHCQSRAAVFDVRALGGFRLEGFRLEGFRLEGFTGVVNHELLSLTFELWEFRLDRYAKKLVRKPRGSDREVYNHHL